MKPDRSRLVAGINPVIAAVNSHPETIRCIWVATDTKNQRARDIEMLARDKGIEVRSTARERLEDMAGMDHHQDVLAELAGEGGMSESQMLEYLKELDEDALLLVLDGVTDPHNLGACLRSAEAAGVHAVIVPKDRAVGLTPVVRKASAGASETVPLVQVTNLARTLRALKEQGIWLCGTMGEATTDLFEQDLTGPLALVMGSEGEGLRRLTADTCDYLISIAMHGTAESLNVSVATGVCLFEVRRQRRLT